MQKGRDSELFFISDKTKTNSTKKAVIPIKGMHCASCVSKIEKALTKVAGVKSATVNFANAKAFVEYDSALVSPLLLHDAIEKSGYKSEEEKHIKADKANKKKQGMSSSVKSYLVKFVVALVFTLPLMYIAMGDMIGLPNIPLSSFLLAVSQGILATIVMLAGFSFYTSGLKSLFKLRPNMNSLISVGTLAAWGYSIFVLTMIFKNVKGYSVSMIYFETAGFIITILLFGKLLEEITKGKANSAISKLIRLQPRTAFVIKNKKEFEVSIDELKAGDVIIVKPGGKIPVDGFVIEGYSSVDESLITGESIPIEKTAGSEVIGGSINKAGALTVRASTLGSASILAQIIRTVQEAQGSKPKVQDVANKVASFVVPAVFVVALVSFASFYFLSDLSLGLTTAIAVLIIACPCSIGLAIPTAVMVGFGKAANYGILFKNANALQTASNLNLVVFDKTGTLTVGKPQVTDAVCFGKTKQDALIQLAAIVEKKSEHPLASAILEHARAKGLKVPTATKFRSHPGEGVEATYKSKTIFLGNKSFIASKKIDVSKTDESVELLETQGKTVVFVATKKGLVGILGIRDELKPFAKDTVASLSAQGFKVAMLSGDNERTANAIAREAGIEQVFAKARPEHKASIIKDLQDSKNVVAMVGDGINDAPALSQANLGIALGSGTDIALESGDVILIKDDLRDVLTSITIAKKTMRKIKQNLFWAFAYNVVLIPVAAGAFYPFTGWLLSPVVASAAMALSSVSVVSSSLLLKLYKPKLAGFVPAPHKV